MNDIAFILYWWFILLAIGVIFFPFTTLIFGSFSDRGYIFSKTIGIVLLSYATFILAIFKVAPFSLVTILCILVAFIVINFLIGRRYDTLELTRNKLLIFLFEEIIFLLCICVWSYVRGHEPSIHSLEKYMDFGFINSILRAEFLPPKDIWFTPEAINYYYFGHFVTAFLTKLSNIPSAVSYNIMLATLFAFTFTSSFSLGINLLQNRIRLGKIKLLASGILSGVLVTLAGNLQTIYSFFVPYNPESPVPPWMLKFSFFAFQNGALTNTYPNSYWYANATRFIPFTIHEFPLYSFVVADLHGHVIDIPFVLLAVVLSYALFRSSTLKNALLVFYSLLLAVMYMTNAWDGIIYFLLIVFVLGVRNSSVLDFDYKKGHKKLFLWHLKKIHNVGKFILLTIRQIGIILLGFIVFSFPFSLHFKPFVSGVGVICPPEFLVKLGKIGPLLFEADHCQRSAVWQLAILYGFFYFFVFAFFIFLLKRKSLEKHAADFFVLILIALSTLLIVLPEFIYAKDIYPAHYRANTMFKLVYQAFILLSLSSAYIIRILLARAKKIIVIPIFILCTLVLIYPYFAIQSYYQTPSVITKPCTLFPGCAIVDIKKSFDQDKKNYKGLDGLTYLKTLHPSDYEAIVWINKNITGQPVLLEAQGDSYTDYERISANTGLPTILGWTVHEWLWRGTYDIPAPRIEEVKTIYESADLEKTSSLLKKYAVEYVYIGELEKQKHPTLDETKFQQLGSVVYQNKDARIYKIGK